MWLHISTKDAQAPRQTTCPDIYTKHPEKNLSSGNGKCNVEDDDDDDGHDHDDDDDGDDDEDDDEDDDDENDDGDDDDGGDDEMMTYVHV
eukprot:10902036-Karenia_brevis.AAC.1